MSSLHTSIYLKNEGAKSIVLLIHGFMASPKTFESLTKAVYENSYSAAALLLPGHGGTAKDFETGTAEGWQNHVNSEIERFSRDYTEIWLVGHSMGGLLSLGAAIKYSEIVRGVFAIACPLKLAYLSPNHIKVRTKQIFASKDNPIRAAYLEKAGVPQSVEMIWRILKPATEVTKLMRITKANLPQVTVPVAAVYSTSDELISIDSADILKEGLTGTEYKQTILKDSLHAMYTEHDQAVIEKTLFEFLKRN